MFLKGGIVTFHEALLYGRVIDDLKASQAACRTMVVVGGIYVRANEIGVVTQNIERNRQYNSIDTVLFEFAEAHRMIAAKRHAHVVFQSVAAIESVRNLIAAVYGNIDAVSLARNPRIKTVVADGIEVARGREVP